MMSWTEVSARFFCFLVLVFDSGVIFWFFPRWRAVLFMRLLWLPHNSVCLCWWRVTSIVRILRISSSLQMQFNWEHYGGQTLWLAGTSPTHSFFFFQRFAELMSRISRNPVDFKATRICGWLGWVFRARRLVVDRQVRHFRAPTRFKCLRFGFTIFLSAFYFVVVIFLLFFLFFFA